MASLNGMGRSAAARMLAALESQEYRILWFSSMASGAASWSLIVGRGWLVYSLSESSTWVGLTTFAAMVPLVAVPPVAGLLADRMDRRKLLAWSLAVNLVSNLLLAALVVAGVVQVWHLVLLAFISGVARAAEFPTVQALVPNMVPREHLLNALALNSASQHGSRLVGPGLTGPVLAAAGAGGAFFLASAFYLVSLGLVLRMKTVSKGAVAPSKGVLGNLLAGITYAYSHRLVALIILLVAVHCAFTMSFEALLPSLSEGRLGAGGEGFSYLMMAVGAGSLVGTLALAWLKGEKGQGQLVLWLGLLSGLSPLALAASTNLPMAGVSAAAMGLSQAGFMTVTATIIQSTVPDAIRGRVMSIYVLHAGGVMSFANLANGSLADYITAPVLLTVAAAVFLGALLVSLLVPTLRRLYVGQSATERAAV